MPFVYLGTDDYEQLGGAYRPIIQAFELGDDGIALTPKEDSDLCKKNRASSFAPPASSKSCVPARVDEVCTGANFIAATPQGRLYATDGMGKAIVALEPDPEDGELRLINKQSCAEVSAAGSLCASSLKKLLLRSTTSRATSTSRRTGAGR